MEVDVWLPLVVVDDFDNESEKSNLTTKSESEIQTRICRQDCNYCSSQEEQKQQQKHDSNAEIESLLVLGDFHRAGLLLNWNLMY